MNEPRILTFDELKAYGVLLGRRQVDRLESEGRFPKRVPIGEWRVGWVTDEIKAWVDAKIQARQMGVGALGAGKKKIGRV